MIDLRHGDYREALRDVVEVDAVITDAPYSARTHGGYNAQTIRRAISYDGWADDDVAECCDLLVPRCRGWVVTITDHILMRSWEQHLERLGRYVFAPLPWYAPGSRVRLSGDGPSSWTCWIVVARPRTGTYRDGTHAARWGTLPGGYQVSQDRGAHIGGKPIALMRALVRHYSRPGDLVLDPCAGYGTTLRAAAIEGRRAVGCEVDAETYEHARRRCGLTDAPIDDGPQVDLFGGAV